MKYCPQTRPFSSVEEMNDTIIHNWNSKVTDDDEVYCLGDWCFDARGDFLDSLNGKIHAIRGNHDRRFLDANGHRLESINDILTVKDGDYRIVLCHYRIYEWPDFYRKTLHFHGHSHGQLTSTKRAIDVGMDNPSWNFAPVTLDEILNVIPTYIDHPDLF